MGNGGGLTMKKYSISYSKTNEDTLLEDHHFLIPSKWDSLETKKFIVDLLNDKEKEIEELRKENKFLKWYCEELEVHLPKKVLDVVKEFYKKYG